MFPFFCPFPPNIVTFSIGLKGACTYSMWSIVEHLLSRVCSGEWRSLRTRNLAPSRSLTPQRTSEGCERCRYAFRDRLCSPPFLSLRHTSGWTSDRGVRAMIVTRAVVACSPTRYVTRATLPRLLWHGTFGFCEEYYIF